MLMKSRQVLSTSLLLLTSFATYCDALLLGGLGIGATVAAIGAGYKWGTCVFKECCTDKWTRPPTRDKKGVHNLFKERLFGQHLVMKTVPAVIYNHIYDEHPRKALVMSFHGWTGCGKNYVAELISEYIYREGAQSSLVNLKIATEHYPNSSNAHVYRTQLQNFVKEKTRQCERSLFIFDEMDDMPSGVMDVLKPFIDYHQSIDKVDYRKNIFIFLNNVAGNQISEVALNNFRSGEEREAITNVQMEEILSLYTLKLEGGFKDSELILSGLVDYFIPFLPLERVHVRQCAQFELNRRIEQRRHSGEHSLHLDREARRDIIEKVVAEIQFYPKGEEIFSKTGCKSVSKKVDMYLP